MFHSSFLTTHLCPGGHAGHTRGDVLRLQLKAPVTTLKLRESKTVSRAASVWRMEAKHECVPTAEILEARQAEGEESR